MKSRLWSGFIYDAPDDPQVTTLALGTKTALLTFPGRESAYAPPAVCTAGGATLICACRQ